MDTSPKIIKEESSLNEFLKTKQNVKIIDAFSGALNELFFIENPGLKKEMLEVSEKMSDYINNNKLRPEWIYFPWSNVLIKNVPEETYFTLRTARNREVITTEEQNKYRQLCIGIAGLSVGSQILSALVQSGGPKKIKIADFDLLEMTNLNRLHAKLSDIGSNKTHIAARETWSLDPYAELELWENGLTKENIKDFIIGNQKLNVFIDEMDDISLKIYSRFIARENGIPTLMATDSGDSVIIDVERFDLERNREIFHGLIGEMTMEESIHLNYKQWLSFATRIVGAEFLPSSMRRSILNIGKTIPSVPQLGTTASVAGAAMSYIIRRIANNEEMPSGRYVLNIEKEIKPGYDSPYEIEARKSELEDFINSFNK